MNPDVLDPDVPIPTFERPRALAVTLATLLGQTHRRFRVVVSDQSERFDSFDAGEVRATVRALRTRGTRIETLAEPAQAGGWPISASSCWSAAAPRGRCSWTTTW